MKKPLLIIFICLICLSTSLGQGLQIGVKGSLNSTWLLNNHVLDASANDQTYIPSFGQYYGLSGAMFFNEKLGIEANVLYDTHRQKYSDEDETFESETTLHRISVPLMLKIRSKTGAFFEIGAIYNSLTTAEFTLAVDSFSFPTQDVRDKMAKSSIDAMFGIGVDINMFAGLSLTTALRFWGSMTDLRGVDAFGGDLSDPLWLTAAYNGEYQQTRAASAGFLMGLTYSIGKIAGD